MLAILTALVVIPTLKDVVAKVQDPSPIHYRFVCEYLTVSTKGEVLARKRLRGTYHIEKQLSWTDVSVAEATKDRPYGNEKPQEFMNGFAYAADQVKNDGNESFFGKIPSDAVECRNLIWDTHMFEGYAYDHLGELRLNQPLTISKDKTSTLGVAGSFHDNDVNLTWIGDGEWNGARCALIRYRAFLNTFDYKIGTLKLLGTSDYWGEIWLSKRTRRIENATIYESVGVLMGQSQSPIRSFRIGTFEAVHGR